MNVQQTKQRGFTIIEVVLVLAIAALIFLMIFIALPALQRGQRDTARKNDVSTVLSAISSWKGNNVGGTFPTPGQLNTYVTNKSVNTTTVTTQPAPTGTANVSTSVPLGTVIAISVAKCVSTAAGGSVTYVRGTSAQYIVITQLEDGTTGYCQQG